MIIKNKNNIKIKWKINKKSLFFSSTGKAYHNFRKKYKENCLLDFKKVFLVIHYLFQVQKYSDPQRVKQVSVFSLPLSHSHRKPELFFLYKIQKQIFPLNSHGLQMCTLLSILLSSDCIRTRIKKWNWRKALTNS